MEPTHSLLTRQLKRHFGDGFQVPAEWRGFIEAINEAYHEFDQDRAMVEHSLEMSSQELMQANSEMRAVFQAIPDLLFRLDHQGRILDLKAGTSRDLVLQRQDFLGKRIQDISHKNVGDQFSQAIRQVVEQRTVVRLEYTLNHQGQETSYEARLAPLLEDQIVAIIQNITERKRTELFRAGQSAVLELIATGAPLEQTLSTLLRLIESQAENMICSVLLLDDDGKRLGRPVAPSLPESYTRLLEGIPIGPQAGCCGTAAYLKEPVVAPDIVHDPLWHDCSGPAIDHGLRACWSSPILSPDGSVRGTFAMYYREVRSPSSKEKRLVEIATQMAGIAIERKRAEQDLRRAVSLLQSTLESTADGILVVDAEGRIVSFNERFVTLWQVPRSVLATRDDNDALANAVSQLRDPDAFLRKVRELYANPEAESFDVLEFKDGRVFERYSCPQRLDGKPVGRVWSFRDVTERQRSEEALFNSQHMLRTVLDTIPQRVFWKDRNSVYVGCNKPLALDCGYDDPAGLVGRTDHETCSAANAERYQADDRLVMETDRAKLNYEEPQTRADGTQGWLRSSKVPLHDKDGRVIGVLGTYEDITEHRRLEEQLRQSQKMDAFGQLAAGVAHDFNNILTVIMGNLSMLQTSRLADPARAVALKQAHKAAERAANLTRQLLTFGRRQPMRLGDLDVNEVVATLTKMLQRLIGEHIALEAHYSPGAAPVQADRGMLEQVLINLAVNSRDAMPKGGQLILETATVVFNQSQLPSHPQARPGEFIRLAFTDTGTGIAPEHLPHIFEPFFTTKEVGKGTGLGLATVFSIIEQHHGWIEVESQTDRGTTFRIYLPRLSKNAEALAAADSAPPVRGGTETILLVEDELPVRELMRVLLERHGYRVHSATSGVDALEVWRKHQTDIDLLLTDMVMPEGLGGRELAERLRSCKPGLKIVYCSGYTDDMLGADSPLRNEKNFLEKPFELREFLQTVRDCLDDA